MEGYREHNCEIQGSRDPILMRWEEFKLQNRRGYRGEEDDLIRIWQFRGDLPEDGSDQKQKEH